MSELTLAEALGWLSNNASLIGGAGVILWAVLKLTVVNYLKTQELMQVERHRQNTAQFEAINAHLSRLNDGQEKNTRRLNQHDTRLAVIEAKVDE